jgi:DNA-binding CsgD family transcriptional regulator
MLAAVDPRHHWSYYFESQSPVGGTLHAGFEAGGRQVAVLQAYRREPDRSFLPKDVALMQAASPLIGQALGVALAKERAPAELSAAPASGIVIVEANRSIAFATPAGDDWLRQLRAAEGGTEEPLPIAVWSAAKGLAEQELPVLRLGAMSAIGPVTLEASDGGGGATAIVILPQRPEPRLELPDHWGLTSQQEQIAIQVLGGATNREVAQRLFLSEHTIEWHLRQIYRALDLTSRTQLQARFFRDVGLGEYKDSNVTNE